MKGKAVLITGGAGGLGQAMARRFAECECRVFLTDVNAKGLQKVSSRLGHDVPGAFVKRFPANLAKSDEVTRLFESLKEHTDHLDVVVNNAGVAGIPKIVRRRVGVAFREWREKGHHSTYLGAVSELSDSEWHRILSVNLDGVFYVTREALKWMAGRKQGSIINIASYAGMHGIAQAPAYCASKAAVIGFTKSVAKDAIKAGVRVNAIAPGYIDTDMSRKQTEAMLTWPLMLTPAGRFGTPEEVAACVAFLASDEASYLVGAILTPDGGLGL